MIGQSLGHYQILEKLGQGGMGVVFKARDTLLERAVAIKVLPEQGEERRQRFIQEAKAASALNHRGIVTIHEIGRDQAHDFIVMECIQGRTLQEELLNRRMKVGEVLRIAVEIADALAAAHSAGIVHRDLKPSNIMLSEQGVVKIVDFGLAKLLEFDTSDESAETRSLVAGRAPLTGEGVVLGTIAYMSPEQAEGRPVDARSDIFSFGCVLYEMLSGRRAFGGGSRVTALAGLLEGEPEPLAERVPPELKKLLARCLKKDPARRFQHMQDLKVELQELREDSESGRLAASGALRPARKRPGLAFWGVACLIMILGAGLLAWRLLRAPRPAASGLMVFPLTDYPGIQDHPSFSPDGTELVFHWAKSDTRNTALLGSGQSAVYRKPVGVGEPICLTPQPGAFAPAWSPDGRSIAFLRTLPTNQLALMVMPAQGGPERQLTAIAPLESHPSSPFLAWTPDSRALAVVDRIEASKRFAIYIVDAGTGARHPITFPAQTALGDSGIAFSPYGCELAFIRQASVLLADLHVVTLDSQFRPKGEPRRITAMNTSVFSPAWLSDGRELLFCTPAGPSRLWRVKADGSKPPIPVSVIGDSAGALAVSWKGNRLIYGDARSEAGVFRLDLQLPGEMKRITTQWAYAPECTPDGKYVLAGGISISRTDVLGLNAVILASLPRAGSPRISPDGRKIVFDSIQYDNADIYLMDADGSNLRRLTEEPGEDVVPTWSRDGKWIYFCSNRSGSSQIWKMPSAGGQAMPVTRNGGMRALESKDGRTLYYSKPGDLSSLWRMPVDGGEETLVFEPLFSWLNFDVAEDGIYLVPASPQLNQLAVEFHPFRGGKVHVIEGTRSSQLVGLAVSPDGKTLFFARMWSDSHGRMNVVEDFH